MTCRITLLISIFVFYSLPSFGKRLCDTVKIIPCPGSSGSYTKTTSVSNPTSSSSFNNPASTMVDKGLGVETINYKGWWDVGLISGNGRIGAAVSPTSPEERFFTNHAMETEEDYRNRVVKGARYKSKKVALAVAARLIGKKKKGRRKDNKLQVQLGLLGRYNTETDNMYGGIGLSSSLGPFSFGGSIAEDDYKNHAIGSEHTYLVSTANIGFKYAFFAFDFSFIENSNVPNSRIRITSGSLFFNKVIFTLGVRNEYSDRPEYNYEDKVFEERNRKQSTFLGLQYAPSDLVLLGIYSNYFLLKELSLGLTIFI